MTVGVLAAVTAITIVADGGAWERPQLMFSMVTVAATTCVIAATVLIAMADRSRMAEIGLLGAALMATSVLPLAHGLVTPDVLYQDNAAFRTSLVFAMPVAVLVASPLIFPSTAFGRWAARRWRDWTLLSLLGVFILASLIVFLPDAITTPGPRDPFTIGLAVVMVGAIGSMSVRQLRLYELGRRLPNLVASLSLALLSAAALLPIVDAPYSAASWWLHSAGALGVIGACVGLGVSKRMSPTAHDVLAPILNRDPLAAFELGLSPIVHQFIADLESKDEITRDHTIRTGELALRVGERMGLRGVDLRDLGLAAMLHDVGKVNTPDEILMKPARLTPEEYDVMKGHTIDGEAMLATEPTLAGAARIVRSHHERVDGGGYPDGLSGEQIPLASRIIATCDAIDAMTHDRPYRKALPFKLGFAILREHAGTQWDADVVRAVIATLPDMPAMSRLNDVGRGLSTLGTAVVEADDATADAMAAIPDDISELLAALDAEI